MSSGYDLVFRDATIADGSGGPLMRGDLAVRDGRIAALGTVPGRGEREIDAGGRVLAPGAVDVHTHYDAQLTWDRTASPSPSLGVTTILIGNCGFGIAPAPPAARDLLLKNLSEVEAMSLDSLQAGVNWEFETFGQYLDMLERRSVYPNVAAYASHSVMRTVVMGAAGSERAATADELRQMCGLLRDAMASGAAGMGSSTFENHNGYGGIPVPSRLADDEEFRAFARVIGEFGHGSMMATCGNRTSIEFLEELAGLSKRPVVYAPLLYYSNQPERAHGIAARAAAARKRGAPVYTQASCQPLSMDFNLVKPYPMLTVSPWPQHDDVASLKRTFADPGFRQAIRDSLKTPSGTRIFNGHWDRVEVTIAATDRNRWMEGLSLAEIGSRGGRDPVDVFLDLGLEEDLATTFTAKLLNVEEDKVGELLADDGNMVSLSDAGAHHTFFCDAGFAMHFLGHWVRERGLFDLPTAVRKLSADMADIYGLVDRGRLAVGHWADMILFEPDRISVTRPEKLADLPAGGSRLVRRAPGLSGTWVNGVQVFDGTDYTDVTGPGQVLRSFSKAPPTVAMG